MNNICFAYGNPQPPKDARQRVKERTERHERARYLAKVEKAVSIRNTARNALSILSEISLFGFAIILFAFMWALLIMFG